jgi:hypothetical protein
MPATCPRPGRPQSHRARARRSAPRWLRFQSPAKRSLLHCSAPALSLGQRDGPRVILAGACDTRVCRLPIGDRENSHSTVDRDLSTVRDRTDRSSQPVYFHTVMTATLAMPASNALVNPADERPLSPWWLRAIAIVMVIGFTVLIAITASGVTAPTSARTIRRKPVFVLRQTSDEACWASIEKYIKTAFFGTNIGLAMMCPMLPLQVVDFAT